mmetsp:Transcript_9262/g.12912  ORF Transcript_9262/g.12912 Transcript_9262/m.12912 type:complete len:184 (+) Transcript_9262:67-618(+)|eukprot:CAMPEP_0184478596 /NCGR_PEP_ID=MMETSP0113_2-20130426/578_1 /TAXON_ID=91329 /ORGANISM="Norrisiella sphaerica, Strain BC52" /LENGTH=183 /DNA_ID=CAMNT_0026856445 /DNA_START=72 /DNA_END=623 /DNA_ORIENTATION=+
MSFVNLDIPYTDLNKKSTYTKLEKTVLAVSAIAAIGLVGAVCLGAFSNAQALGAPLAATRANTIALPRLSMDRVGQTMNRASLVSRAQQVNQVAELKKTDGRLGKIVLLGVPVLAWVGFNILGPAQNQLSEMSGTAAKKSAPKARRRAIIGGIASAAAGAAALKDADASEILAALDEVTAEAK